MKQLNLILTARLQSLKAFASDIPTTSRKQWFLRETGGSVGHFMTSLCSHGAQWAAGALAGSGLRPTGSASLANGRNRPTQDQVKPRTVRASSALFSPAVVEPFVTNGSQNGTIQNGTNDFGPTCLIRHVGPRWVAGHPLPYETCLIRHVRRPSATFGGQF